MDLDAEASAEASTRTSSETTYLRDREQFHGRRKTSRHNSEETRSKLYKYKGVILLFFFCLVLMIPYITGLIVGPQFRNLICTNASNPNPNTTHFLSNWLITVSIMGIVSIVVFYSIIVLLVTNGCDECRFQRNGILFIVMCILMGSAIMVDGAGSIIIQETLRSCTIDYQSWRKLYIISVFVAVCSAIYASIALITFTCLLSCRALIEPDY
jgi:hypothetical protein